MDVQGFMEEVPYQDLLGIELVSAADGTAVVVLPFREDLSSSRTHMVAHGGVITSLADSAGAAAAMSAAGAITPTIDLRVDFLSPANSDLRATAEVIRDGNTLSTVDWDVFDTADTHVATGHAVYKTDGSTPLEWIEPDG